MSVNFNRSRKNRITGYSRFRLKNLSQPFLKVIFYTLLSYQLCNRPTYRLQSMISSLADGRSHQQTPRGASDELRTPRRAESLGGEDECLRDEARSPHSSLERRAAAWGPTVASGHPAAVRTRRRATRTSYVAGKRVR